MLLVSGVQHSDSVTSMHIYVYIWASLVAQMVKNCNAGDAALILGWEDPLEKEMEIHSSILAWKNLMDRGAWQATVHGTKNWT